MNPKHASIKVGKRAWHHVVRLTRGVATLNVVPASSLSKRQFLRTFDLPQVSELVKRGNLTGAQQVLLQHYQRRTAPAWPSFPERFTDAAELSTTKLLRRAKDLVEHCFGRERIWLGKKIDWQHNPTPDPRARWTREVHRHRWVAILAIAYERTGDDEYARAFVDLILDWIRANPLPPQKSEENVAWTLMGVGIRSLFWAAAFGAFYRSSAFTDEAKFIMLRSIYDHAQFLFRFKTHHNHVLRESIGLAVLAIYFPEFKQAPSWRQTALTRLAHELTEHVNEDGTSVEMSTGYQWLVVEEFQAVRTLLKEHDLTLPGIEIDSWMIKLYAALAYVLRPGSVWPRLDDGFIYNDTLQLKKLAAAGYELNRPDFVYIAHQGAHGEAPEYTSVALSNAGLYVMRSDWSDAARYLLFDAGQFSGYHGHEDKLGIEVFAYRKAFIVDPGCDSYNVKDPYRVYFASSRAHNTAMIAGKSQVRRWYRSNLDPKRQTQAQGRWITDPAFDYAEGAYQDGYGSYEFKAPRNPKIITNVSHTRRVLFVKPDYWLIIDELQSTAERHNYEIIFNLAPDIKIERISEYCMGLYAEDNSARLYLMTAGSNPYDIYSIRGSTEPIQGWYAGDMREGRVPTTTVVCHIKDVDSTILTTLLYPCRGEAKVDLQVQNVSQSSGLAYQVTFNNRIDYLLLSRDRKFKTFGPCSSDASIAGFRAHANEEPFELFSWRLNIPEQPA